MKRKRPKGASASELLAKYPPQPRQPSDPWPERWLHRDESGGKAPSDILGLLLAPLIAVYCLVVGALFLASILAVPALVLYLAYRLLL